MALTGYLTALQNLIQAPNSPVPLIAAPQQTAYINTARAQVAAEGECIRFHGSLTLAAGTQSYSFATISVPSGQGYGEPQTVRMAFRALNVGWTQLDLRPWEYFASFFFVSGAAGTPLRAAQLGQGVNGTLFFDPIPNGTFVVTLDTVGLPIPLVDDTTKEAIPYPWTDAVPFYAAWLAMMQEQRQADAEMMMRRFETLMRRARQISTPTSLPERLPGGMGAMIAARQIPLTGAPQAPQGGP